MSLIGTIAIAMTADTSALAKGTEHAQHLIHGFEDEVNKAKGFVKGLLEIAAAGALGEAFIHLTELAEDFRRNVEKLEVTFGDSADTIVAQADKMNSAFGTSKLSFTEQASKLGGMMKGVGIEPDKAAEMTSQLMTLAQAMANFSGGTVDEAIAKMRAGLMGRGKGLAEFGISINTAAVQQEALADGMIGVGQKIDGASKIQAGFNILMREGAGVIGNMAERADDSKNAWNEFQGRLQAIEILLGEQLPEVVGPFFSQLSTALVAGMAAWEDFRQSTLNWGSASLEAGKNAVQSMGFVQMAVGKVADTWDVLRLGFYAAQSYITWGLGKIVSALGWIGEKVDWLVTKLGMVADPTTAVYKAWGEDLDRLSNEQWEGFQKKLAEPWPSESVNKYFDNASKKIADLRKQVQAEAIGAKVFGEGGVDKAAKPPKKEFGGAFESGTKEAVSAIIRSQYGIGSDNDMKKLSGNSDKQTALLEAISNKLSSIDANTEDGGGFEMADL